MQIRTLAGPAATERYFALCYSVFIESMLPFSRGVNVVVVVITYRMMNRVLLNNFQHPLVFFGGRLEALFFPSSRKFFMMWG